MNSFLSVELNQSKDIHRDIVLIIPSIKITCFADSYFLHDDKYLQTNKEGYEKVVEVLIHMLLGWKNRIESLELTSICFLPFDFSDEYIGCLRLRLIEKDCINVQYGFSRKIPGFGINPSNVNSFNIEDEDFEKDELETIINKITLLDCIDASIQKIKFNFVNDIEK